MRPPTDFESARVPTEAEEVDPRAAPMMICARLAGRAIIRVVGRCEDAQENSQLEMGLLLAKNQLCSEDEAYEMMERAHPEDAYSLEL